MQDKVLLYLRMKGTTLVVSGDSAPLEDHIIKSSLTGLGFTQTPTNEFVYCGAISESMVAQIASFFEEYGESLEMDQACLAYRNARIEQMRDLEDLMTEGLRIKNVKDSESIDVPMMDKGKCLKPYQVMPVRHAVALGNAANFSVPGSGKTWMAYSAYLLLKHRPKLEADRVDKLLIIGPLSSFRPWETEYREMTGSDANAVRIAGDPRRRREIFEGADRYEIFLVNYVIANVERDQIMRMLQENRFMVVVDESHHIKNPSGTRSEAIRRLSELAHKRMILTGTAVPNTLEDLWAQITFLYPSMDVLGTFEQFQYDLTSPDASQYLNNRLDPFFTRVSKSTLNLPAPKISKIRVPMGHIQRRIYSTIAGHIRDNDANYRSNAVTMRRWRKNSIVYLLEAATDPSLLTSSTQFSDDLISGEYLSIQEQLDHYHEFEIPNKISSVIKLAETNLEQPNKIIIWCSFIATIKKLANALKRFNPLAVYGEIPIDDEKHAIDNRERRIDKFKTSPTNNVLIANPASLAESISLHRVCHHAIYVDRTFNGGNYLQSLDRIHRIGMDPKVETRYTIFMSEDSIDDDIDYRLEIKKRRMQSFLGDDAFKELRMDLAYDDPIGSDDELDEDYKTVLRHLRDARS